MSAPTPAAIPEGSKIKLSVVKGLRAGKTYAPGASISQGDVLAELPFGNRIVLLEVSGRDLKGGIENGLSRLPGASGRFPQVSGMAVEFALDRAPGSRVTAMRIGGAPLDEGKTYRLATLDFLARGGDDYTMFSTARPFLCFWSRICANICAFASK